MQSSTAEPSRTAPEQEAGQRPDSPDPGHPGSVDPLRGVRPLSAPENLSRRELREGIAPPDPASPGEPELDL